jgi:hypothetical protein
MNEKSWRLVFWGHIKICFEPKVTYMPVVYQNNMLTRIELFIKKKKKNAISPV